MPSRATATWASRCVSTPKTTPSALAKPSAWAIFSTFLLLLSRPPSPVPSGAGGGQYCEGPDPRQALIRSRSGLGRLRARPQTDRRVTRMAPLGRRIDGSGRSRTPPAATYSLDSIRKPLCEARRKAYLSENGFAKCHRSPRRCALYEQGYHNDHEGGLLPSSQTPVEETQEVPAQEEEEEEDATRWQRPRASDRAL